MIWRYNQTVVRRMRIKGRKLDPLAARLRLDHLLQTADLHPSWLPPAAIVCLRSLRDPLPRTLKLSSRTPTPSRVWQQAVAAAVQETIRNATSPFNAEVPRESTAVIFKNPAELLASLAMDWPADRLRTNWWWQSLFKGQEVAGIVPIAWLSTPEYVPAALELLSIKHGVEKFARALTVDQARSVLREVTRSFALRELQAALDAGFKEMGLDNNAIPLPQLHDASLNSHANRVRSKPAPPWRIFAPECLDATLGFERQCLIGVALTIRRAHAVATSSRFAQATLVWLRGNSSGSQQSKRELPEEVSRASAHPKSLLWRSMIAPVELRDRNARENSLAENASEGTEAAAPSIKKDLAPATLLRSRAALISSLPSEINSNAGSESEHVSRAPHHPAEAGAPPETSSASFADGPIVDTPLRGLDEVRVETELGGAFYLINVGLFLGLYGDFTTPAETGLTLPIFDFVALTARRLLRAPVKDDPVWELLAQLAGRREIDPPGEGFEPSGEWRVPVQWLEAFPEECGLDWSAESGRLRVSHPSGFLLIDVPLAANPVEQLKRELMVYDPGATWRLNAKSCGLSQNDNLLEQWLDWVVPYLRARLCRAFDDSEMAQKLCAQRATIQSTAANLDIFFALSEHPVEVRSAGLDRDPGWVPAAGRFIRFHYQ